ncbi:mitochondrial carrier domain-containing protein [Endogone sp. FLAS-F59071]|nr:mitochondrial carrier domain-containing protein [Endogone sp. FLAS-F59071]|eukprot:RUS23186.1 mitochondrial carrier domain-containing protein [Endogone sp. FLAS-F59071]
MTSTTKLDPTAPKPKPRPFVHLSAGAVSGLFACTVLQPLDLIKTRLQQQKQQHLAFLKEAKGKGITIAPLNSTIYSTVKDIVTQNGVQGLWRGTTPTIIRNVPGSAAYFFALSEIRALLARASFLSSDKNRDNLVAGATARATVGFVLMPVTVVKVRYESNFYNYKSLYDAFSSIIRSDGIRGLFAGFGATAIRDAPFAGIYVLFYEQFKTGVHGMICVSIPRVHASIGILFTGVVAGVTATCVTQPFDMLKTRMQLKPQIYKNTWQSATKVFTVGV